MHTGRMSHDNGDIREMLLWTKEHPRLPANQTKAGGWDAWGRFSLTALRRDQPCRHFGLRQLTSRTETIHNTQWMFTLPTLRDSVTAALANSHVALGCRDPGSRAGFSPIRTTHWLYCLESPTSLGLSFRYRMEMAKRPTSEQGCVAKHFASSESTTCLFLV